MTDRPKIVVMQAASISWSCGHVQHVEIGDEIAPTCPTCYAIEERRKLGRK